MPGPDPFDGFRFPDPEELEPLPVYQGTDINYGGYEDAYGGEHGNDPRLEVTPGEELGGDGGDLRAFRAYDVNEDSSGWECRITAGVVIENHIRNQGYEDSCDLGSEGEYETSSKLYIPTINSVQIVDPQCDSSVTQWARPWLSLPDPPDPAFIYCQFRTDNHGHIIPWDSSGGDVVFIQAYDSPKKSVHHIPPSPEDPDGLEGEYYWLLNELCQDTSDEVKVSHRFQSNILWQEAFVVDNESGGGSRIYRRFDCVKDSIKLRRILGCYGLQDLETNSNIKLDFVGKNIGTQVYSDPVTGDLDVENGGLANVYAHSSGEIHSCGDVAKFRRLTQGLTASQQQVKVTQDGDIIRITGNNKAGRLRWFNCDVSSGEYDSATAEFVIEWEDGLVISEGVYDIKAGCDSANFPGGANGSFTWLDCDSAAQWTISWQNGLIKTSGNHFLKAGCDSSGGTAITTVNGGHGILVTGTTYEVDVGLDIANIGTGAKIYVDSAGAIEVGDAANLRTLTQSTEASLPQIAPTQTSDAIEIRGNNKTGRIIWRDCNNIDTVLITWEDGLITTAGDQIIKAGCDSSGGGTPT